MSRNTLLFALMCLVWGLTFLPVKIASGYVPPIFLAAARFSVAGVLMLLWAGRDAFAVPPSAWRRLLLTGLLVNTGNYALLFWGTAHATSGLAAVVNLATIPIYTVIASRLIEGIAITGQRIMAILLGIAGLGLLFAARVRAGVGSGQGGAEELWGLAAVASGTLLYCVGAVLSRRIVSTMPTLTLAGWQTSIGALGLIGVSLMLEPVGLADLCMLAQWPVWPSLAMLIFGGSLIGFTIFMRLLRDWGAFHAGLYAFVSPVIAVSAGVIARGEPFGLNEALGAVLMFAAAAIAVRR